MHYGIDDIQIHRSRSNYLSDGENIIDTASSSFMPNLELVNYYNDPNVKTILRPSGGIDLEELLTYFEPLIIVRWRNENITHESDKS